MKNFAEWGEINKCTGTPAPLPGQASCNAYPTCADAADTILCVIRDGAHCGSYDSFGIVNLAWDMFQKHALP